jgi:hypothetical protein
MAVRASLVAAGWRLDVYLRLYVYTYIDTYTLTAQQPCRHLCSMLLYCRQFAFY